MKTIAVGTKKSNITVFLVLAGLAALYLYRRKGGSVSALLDRGVDGVRSARDLVNRVAPEVGQVFSKSASTAAETGKASTLQ